MNASTLDHIYFWFALAIQVVFFIVFYLHVRQEYKRNTEDVRHQWDKKDRNKIKENLLDDSSK